MYVHGVGSLMPSMHAEQTKRKTPEKRSCRLAMAAYIIIMQMSTLRTRAWDCYDCAVLANATGERAHAMLVLGVLSSQKVYCVPAIRRDSN